MPSTKKAALPMKKSKPIPLAKLTSLKTKPPPDERDPSRRFYTSLLKQNKNSAMAKK